MNRNNEGYLNALGAQRIPDPTTAGDFTRRFKREDIAALMECINVARQRVWKEGREEIFPEAMIDIDGTIAPTYEECKEGMDISYKGIWGYMGVCAVNHIAGQHEGGVIHNEPAWKRAEPRRGSGVDRPGNRVGEAACSEGVPEGRYGFFAHGEF